ETSLLKTIHAASQSVSAAVEVDDKLSTELAQTWDYVFNVASRHRLFAMDNHKGPFPVQFAVMHRAAYAGLISLMESQKTWRSLPMDKRSFFDRVLASSMEEKNPERYA